MPFFLGKLDAAQMPFALGKPAVVQRLFALGKPAAVQMLSLLGSFAALGTFFAPPSLFALHMPSAPRTPVFLSRASPDRLAAPGTLADLDKVAVLYRLFGPQAPVSLYLLAALHRLASPGRLSVLVSLRGHGFPPL